MKKIIYPIIAALLFLAPACKSPIKKTLLKEVSDSHPILLKEVNIFNGRDPALILSQDVLIKNGIIQQIGPNIKAANLDKLKTINAKGKTLMPGLIDAHVHLIGSGSAPWDNIPGNKEYNLAAYLYAGITTVYDLGGLAGSISKLAKKVEKGKILGPAIYNTHLPITIKNSHPIPLAKKLLPWPLNKLINSISPTIDRVEEAPSLIKKYLKKNVDYIKIICDEIPPGSPVMSFDQMKALIDEAHRLHKKVFVHIGSPQNAIDAVNAGADILAHGIWRGQLTAEQADIIAAAKVPIIYTLTGFENTRHIYAGTFAPSEMDKRIVPEEIYLPVTGENGKEVHQQEILNEFFEDVVSKSIYWQSNFKLLHERNVTILVGTDSNLPGAYAGSSYLQEMDLLKKFGLSNYKILKGATYSNARLFLEDPDFGMIEEGKKANLLLLNGNPLENLDHLKEPEYIFLNGNIITRAI